jgi:hypothetical protein
MARGSTSTSLLLALLASCAPSSSTSDGGEPDGGLEPCAAAPYWCNPSVPAQVELGMRVADSFSPVAADGQPVDLEFPVQGGHVLFVAARIQNLDGCAAELSSRLIDPASGEVLAQEKRSVDFTVKDGMGGISQLSETANTANVPACPAFGPRDVVGAAWHLEVKVKDRSGKEATAQRLVVPSCRQADAKARAACICECSKNYYLGKCG